MSELISVEGKSGAKAIAKRLFECGESDQTIYKYLTMNVRLKHKDAIEIIRQLNIKNT